MSVSMTFQFQYFCPSTVTCISSATHSSPVCALWFSISRRATAVLSLTHS